MILFKTPWTFSSVPVNSNPLLSRKHLKPILIFCLHMRFVLWNTFPFRFYDKKIVRISDVAWYTLQPNEGYEYFKIFPNIISSSPNFVILQKNYVIKARVTCVTLDFVSSVKTKTFFSYTIITWVTCNFFYTKSITLSHFTRKKQESSLYLCVKYDFFRCANNVGSTGKAFRRPSVRMLTDIPAVLRFFFIRVLMQQ
jgi:hypothetical protein